MAISPFQEIEIQECGEPVVELTSVGIACEPRYFNQGLTASKSIFVRKSVAEKLLQAQENLQGLKFLVWDGLRSRNVQNSLYQRFWNEMKMKYPSWSSDQLLVEVGKYVTPADDPKRIPPHSTGGAIDLTLTEKNGSLLDMGTDFDDFTSKASLYSLEISEAARQNRAFLHKVMHNQGFIAYPDEWWHFGYGDQLSKFLSGGGIAIYGEVKLP